MMAIEIISMKEWDQAEIELVTPCMNVKARHVSMSQRLTLIHTIMSISKGCFRPALHFCNLAAVTCMPSKP